MAAALALAALSIVLPLVLGFALRGVAQARPHSLDREPYFDRYSGLLARVIAVVMSVWLSGPRLADATGWRRSTTVGTVAVASAVFVGVALPMMLVRFSDGPRRAAPGRRLYSLWVLVVEVAPWLIAGLGGAAFGALGLRLLFVGVAIACKLVSTRWVTPWLAIRTLTEQCPQEIDRVVSSLCAEHGVRMRAGRVMPYDHRKLLWAGVVAGPGDADYVVLSSDLAAAVPRPLFDVIVMGAIWQLRGRRARQRAQLGDVLLMGYLYGFVSLAHGSWPLLVAAIMTLKGIYVRSPARFVDAVDRFAVGTYGAATVETALTLVRDINGTEAGDGAGRMFGLSRSQLTGRIDRLRAEAGADPDPAAGPG